MSAVRVLVVEDDRDQREALVALLADPSREVRAAASLRQAGDVLSAWPPDAIVTDYHLPDGQGLSLLEAGRRLPEPPALLLVTAFGTVSLAVEALRRGAVDVQVKPVDPEALLATLARALKTRALEQENRALSARLAAQPAPAGVVAESEAMKQVLAIARRVAPSKVNVLVTGESGTGKEVVAQLLHREGARPDGPFVALNCAALPEGVLESELFGHVRGAFTGAVRDHRGVFEQAQGGTLFLDEIGEIPASVQVRLLRVLEQRTVTRVGEGKERTVDFRLVAATNRDLAKDVAAGRFREDLLYRLEVMRIHLPPLRERPADIAPLARHLLAEAARENGLRLVPLSEEALAALARQPWPGNVRQLRNVVASALIRTAGRAIEAGDLAVAPAGEAAGVLPAEGVDLAAALEAFERGWIVKALAATLGSVPQAAERLRLPERTLRYRMEKLGVDAAPFRRPGAEPGKA
ncbi:MAG: sigma-54-dependent transcriptional regulator [Planctomycetia bacterium]